MKKYIVIGGLALAGYQLFKAGSNKLGNIQNVAKSLIVKIDSISTPEIVSGGTKFDTNLSITNPASEALNLNGSSIVKITKIDFYTASGDYLGESFPNITNISIAPHSTIQVKNVPTFVRVVNFGNLLTNAINIYLDPKQLKIETTISAFGQTFKV